MAKIQKNLKPNQGKKWPKPTPQKKTESLENINSARKESINTKPNQGKKWPKPTPQKKTGSLENTNSTRKELISTSKASSLFLKKKRKIRKPILEKPSAIIHFFKTESNAISTLTDMSGNPKAWVSAGSLGIKGSRKSTVYASEAVAKALGEKTLSLGFNKILVKVRGIGFAKTKAIKILKKEGLQITHLYDVTPTPHNGCRLPRKQRK